MLSSYQHVLMNFQAISWVCVLAKTFSHLAVVAVGQSTDSSKGGALGLIHKQLLHFTVLYFWTFIILQLRQDVKTLCWMLYSGGRQLLIRSSLGHTWFPNVLRISTFKCGNSVHLLRKWHWSQRVYKWVRISELSPTCGSNGVCVLFPPEPTLTVSNLYDALKEVKELNQIGHGFNIPASKQKDINSRYSSDSQRKQAILEEFINNHPAPSWRLVAEFLCKINTGGSVIHPKFGKYLGALQTIKRKYLKGR